ncbi:hypothetical protein TNCT_243541 [Trichonephila clavata]|uniref:Uncharacterized protein n=1 Tax=Trichonephila clavata TaxID=2740835 RepID=A0A8X6LF92_TRICU|nr:hypothetical protein TNCT_243541 [Trichonephila clavata]
MGCQLGRTRKRSSRIMQMKRRNLVVFIPPLSERWLHRQDEQPISVGKRRLVTKMHSLSTPPLYLPLQKVEVFVVLAWMGGLDSVPSFKWIFVRTETGSSSEGGMDGVLGGSLLL